MKTNFAGPSVCIAVAIIGAIVLSQADLTIPSPAAADPPKPTITVVKKPVIVEDVAQIETPPKPEPPKIPQALAAISGPESPVKLGQQVVLDAGNSVGDAFHWHSYNADSYFTCGDNKKLIFASPEPGEFHFLLVVIQAASGKDGEIIIATQEKEFTVEVLPYAGQPTPKPTPDPEPDPDPKPTPDPEPPADDRTEIAKKIHGWIDLHVAAEDRTIAGQFAPIYRKVATEEFDSPLSMMKRQAELQRDILGDSTAWKEFGIQLGQEIGRLKLTTIPQYRKLWLEIADAFESYATARDN